MVVLVYQVMSVSDVSPTALMVIAPSSPIGVSHYTFRGEELYLLSSDSSPGFEL